MGCSTSTAHALTTWLAWPDDTASVNDTVPGCRGPDCCRELSFVSWLQLMNEQTGVGGGGGGGGIIHSSIGSRKRQGAITFPTIRLNAFTFKIVKLGCRCDIVLSDHKKAVRLMPDTVDTDLLLKVKTRKQWTFVNTAQWLQHTVTWKHLVPVHTDSFVKEHSSGKFTKKVHLVSHHGYKMAIIVPPCLLCLLGKLEGNDVRKTS